MKKTAAIGHLLDRYDQALFALLASTLAPLFFPFEDPLYNLIATFCLLPLGLLAKPLGAYVFGRLGDQFSYQKSFSITLLGMAFATGGMGLLPTYEQVGVLAPVLLCLCRLLQNFFSAGETTGAAIAMVSQVEEKKKTWASSLLDAMGMLGTLLGSAICTIALYSGLSWRILFLSGCLTGIVGWWVRGINPAPLPPQAPIQRVSLWRHKKAIAAIAAVSGFSYANYYLITLFFTSFIPLIGAATQADIMAINTWMLGADLCLLPIVGALIRNRDRWIRVTLALTALIAIPLYLLLDPAGGWTWTFVWGVFMILGVIVAAPFHAWSLSIAPKESQFAVHAMGRAIGSRFIGAPAPALALWLYHFSGVVWAPSLIVVTSALLAFILMMRLRLAAQLRAAR